MMRAWLTRDPTGGTLLCIFSESEICNDPRNVGWTRGDIFSQRKQLQLTSLGGICS